MLKSKPTLVQALATAVIESLQTRGEAVIPGLGTLRRVHSPARTEKVDGQTQLLPPRESVVFEASHVPNPDRS